MDNEQNKNRKYRNYTDQDIKNNAAVSNSMSQLLTKLNLRATGGNYNNMKRLLQKLDINCQHWNGQGWSKGQRLKDWSKYTSVSALKKQLLKQRGNICECCKNTHWMDFPMKLQAHHMDGDKTNNIPQNIQLLCPNCHSYTDNWKNTKTKQEIQNQVIPQNIQLTENGNLIIQKKESIKQNLSVKIKIQPVNKKCLQCDNLCKKSSSGLCANCMAKKKRKIDRPSYQSLVNDVKYIGYRQVGIKYKVSDNSIKKWIKQYQKQMNIPHAFNQKKYEFRDWSKYDIVKMVESKMTFPQIAKVIGCDSKSVRNQYNKLIEQ